MERITEKMLQKKIDYLNQVTSNPKKSWERYTDGQGKQKMKANIGNYHLDGAYGGVCLHQMMNEGGGVHSVFNCGYVPKRELFELIRAFMCGLEVEVN